MLRIKNDLTMEMFKVELGNTINELLKKYQIPMYFVNNIFNDIHSQISSLAQEEYNKAQIEYDKKEEKDVKDKE